MYTNNWLLGRDLQVRITIIKSNANGVYEDDGNTLSLVGKLDSASIRVETVSEEVSPMASRKYNHVAIAEDATLELREILSQPQTYQGNGNILPACARANAPDAHARVVLTRAGKAWTFTGLINEYEESYERGKNVGVMRMTVIDDTIPLDLGAANPGTLNPTYA